jgi:WD40 repeat protein
LSSFSNIVLASTDGATITPISLTSGPVDSIGDIDWSPSTRTVIYATRRASAYDSGSILWSSQDGAEPVEILQTPVNTSIETPRISDDGTLIVYSLVYWRKDKEQLWIVNIDGSDNRLLVDRIRDHITMPPIAGQRENFGLSPVGWSRGNAKVFLSINIHFMWLCPQSKGDLGWPTICKECDYLGCELEEIDEGMPPKETIWEYDLRTGEFREVPVWKGILAPDLLRIANVSAQHASISIEGCSPFGCEVAIPPFSITVTDLITGSTRAVMESYTSTIDHIVWSPDGRKIAFSLRAYDPSYINQFREVPFPAGNRDDEGIYILDLVTRKVRRVVPGLARHVHAWMPDDTIVYHSEGLFASIRADGTKMVVIDIRAHPYFFGLLD